VIGIEHLPELSEMSKRNLVKDPELKSLIDNGELAIVTGDGRLGYPEEAPFDAIHVGAAAPVISPSTTGQLKTTMLIYSLCHRRWLISSNHPERCSYLLGLLGHNIL